MWCRNKFRTPKKTTVSNTSLDKFLLGAQTPEQRAQKRPYSVVQSSVPIQRSIVNVEFSLSSLKISCKLTPVLPKNEWFCIKKMEGGWLCSNNQEIIAVNFTRLYEMILYSRLLEDRVIPSRPIHRPILIDQKFEPDIDFLIVEIFIDIYFWTEL